MENFKYIYDGELDLMCSDSHLYMDILNHTDIRAFCYEVSKKVLAAQKENKEAEPSTSTNKSSIQLPSLEEFVKEAKRFQKSGEVLGGVTLIDVIEHLHDFIVRQLNT